MKQSTNTKIFLFIAITLSIVLSACSAQSNTSNNNNNNPAASQTTSTITKNLVKLSDSQYAKSAYLISSDTIDANAQAALAGFTLNKVKNNDGTTTITLTSTNAEYKSQAYILQNGQQLYFIETNMGDDSGNQEYDLRDDTAIIVDAQGYIVQ